MVIVTDNEKLKDRSKSYLFWKMCYTEGIADIEHLREAVLYQDISVEEFKLITGKDYLGG